MTPATTERMQADLNALIDAYEARRSADGTLELGSCLPPASHPLYQDARRELMRIDLEYGWRDARPRRLDDYFQMFPDLGNDRVGVQQIAFEEYRLRVLAGENPSAAEYERRYGITTDDWPGSDVDLAKVSKTIVVSPAEVARDPVLDTAATAGQIDTPVQEWDMLRPRVLSGFGTGAVLDRPVPSCKKACRNRAHDEVSFLLAQVLAGMLPEVGTTFLKFQLIAELGRGGFGRVYLAHQGDLANRLVALKITVDLQGEEEKLAQLQHTNVVPIYSVHKAGALCTRCACPTSAQRRSPKLPSSTNSAQGPGVPASGGSLVQTLHARTAEFLTTVRNATGGKMHLTAGDSSVKGGPMPQTLKTLGDADYVARRIMADRADRRRARPRP